MQALRRARPLTLWVLALLWCVLAGSALAPAWASTAKQGLYGICASTPDAAALADPQANALDTAAPPHTLDCALCLPVAAPPGAALSPLSADSFSHAAPWAHPAAPRHAAVEWRWSARAPPRPL
jgi:hypothetical protein